MSVARFRTTRSSTCVSTGVSTAPGEALGATRFIALGNGKMEVVLPNVSYRLPPWFGYAVDDAGQPASGGPMISLWTAAAAAQPDPSETGGWMLWSGPMMTTRGMGTFLEGLKQVLSGYLSGLPGDWMPSALELMDMEINVDMPNAVAQSQFATALPAETSVFSPSGTPFEVDKGSFQLAGIQAGSLANASGKISSWGRCDSQAPYGVHPLSLVGDREIIQLVSAISGRP